MYKKKAKHARLESRRWLLFQVGLVVSTSMSFAALEWSDFSTDTYQVKAEAPENVNLVPIVAQAPPEILEDIIMDQKADDDSDPFMNQNQNENTINNNQLTNEVFESKDRSKINNSIELITTGPTISNRKKPKISGIDKIIGSMDAQQEAQFNGDMYAYLYSKISYPRIALKSGQEGKVGVEFVVGKDGKVRDVKVFKSAGFGFDEEAVQAVKSMPNWIPAENYGYKVSVRYRIPILFKTAR